MWEWMTHREIRSTDDKVAVSELPESPEECRFCMGYLRDGLYECCFIDPECPTPSSHVICCLSLHGYCNMLKLKEETTDNEVKDKHTESQCQESISKLQPLIETTIDTLIEVGNGVSDEDLHALANQWIAFRDLFNTPTDK